MPEERPKGKTTDFVNRLVRDPRHPPDAALFQGFLGASAEAEHTRLYFDAELGSWVDIPNAAILHTEEVSKEQSPLGGSYVWVERSAKLVPGRAERARVEARYLEGAIVQEHLAATQPGFQLPGAAWPGPVAPPSVVLPICPTHTIACQPSVAIVCPTHQITCPTRPIVCQHSAVIVCHPSVLSPCPTLQVICPTRPIICQHSAVVVCHPSVLAPCPTHQIACPTQPIVCRPTILECATQPVQCAPSVAIPCQSIPACPSVGACPSIACGGVGPGLVY